MTKKKQGTIGRFLFKNEGIGDFSGAGTFQGGPFGFGNRYQLADSEIWPGLVDPALDTPENASLWPALKAQEEGDEDSDLERFSNLESGVAYDNRNHISPLQDTERDDLLNPDHDTEPCYFYSDDEGEYVAEDASRMLYRDLPGFPRMNTLADPEDQVPDDQEPGSEDEEERYDSPDLLPSPRDGAKGKPYGVGDVNDPTDLNLQKGAATDTNMFDPMNPSDLDGGNELTLTKNRNQTLNRWKETDPNDIGHTNRDLVFNHLVKPVDFIKKSWGQTDYKKKLDEPDDVQMAVGYAGVISNPVKHVPGPTNIYGRNNLYEAATKPMASTKDKSGKREKFVPEDLDKAHSTETYGTGVGQILKRFEGRPDKFDGDRGEIKQVQRLPRDSSDRNPWNHDRETVVAMVQTALFKKLAALTDKE